VDVGAYLHRIGLARPPEPTLDGLAELALAHLYAVPFENLDIAAGRPLASSRTPSTTRSSFAVAAASATS
jgi:arylamine N-acetyltransferase